ncbi:MAG: VanZ family protein [bacterium]|nr:VanZ family protein [bacterium]
MKNKVFKVAGGVLLAISCLLIVDLIVGILQGGRVSMSGVIRAGILIGAPTIIGTALMFCGIHTKKQRRQVVKGVTWAVFVTYGFILASILFLGQRDNGITYEYEGVMDYLRYSVNLISFSTIIMYLESLVSGHINVSTIIENLVGNLLLFMPMGIFLPSLFKRVRSWGAFVGRMLFLICTVEVVQIFTRTGAFDIDDVILNLSGACLMFWIVKKDVISKLLNQMYILDNVKNYL